MRVVAKIGTASITTEDGNVNREAIISLCGGVASLRHLLQRVVLQGCVRRRARRALPKSWLSGSSSDL